MSDTETRDGADSMQPEDRVSTLEQQVSRLEQKNEELHDKLADERSEKKKYQQRLDRLSRENKKLKQSPLFVATVEECLAGNEVVIKQHGNNQEAVTEVTDEMYDQLETQDRVAIDNSLNIVKEIEEETDSRARVMEVKENPDITYNDIGGVEPQIREVREAVEQPLTNPEVFEEVGVEPPKGVLLHGPPGTGKTMLAKAVANETDATFIQLSGSDLARKFIGEGARLVRELFQLARDQEPAVLFIDEIDAIGSKRTDSKTSGDAEVQRTLMQLLNEMDGFDQRGDVAVIAATNRLDMLDDAILRPGRFDRLVEVGEPDRDGREQILNIHTRGMTLADTVDLSELADMTTDATGAEIAALCTEAGMMAIRDDRTTVQSQDFKAAYEKLHDEREDDAAAQATGPVTGFA